MSTATVDLMPAARQAARASANARQRRAMLGAIACVLIGAGAVFFRASTAPADTTLAPTLATLNARNDAMQRAAQDLGARIGEINRRNADAPLGPQPDYSALLTLVADACEEAGVLRQLELKVRSNAWATDDAPERITLRLRGVAMNQSDAWGLALEFERLGLFQKVRLVGTQRSVLLTRDVVAFELECVIGEPDSPKPAGGAR